MKTFIVKYQVGTYSGTTEVWADENEDHDVIIAKAKKRLFRDGHPGMCYEHFEIENP